MGLVGRRAILDRRWEARVREGPKGVRGTIMTIVTTSGLSLKTGERSPVDGCGDEGKRLGSSHRSLSF